MSRLAEYLAHVSLRIQAQRAALAADPEPIQDADPVPARLTAEGVPMFCASRTLPRADSAAALSMGRDIAAMCGHDAGRIELFAAAALGNAHAIARTVNNWQSDNGALDHG